MNYIFKKIFKLFFSLIFLSFFLTSCSIIKDIAYKSPSNHKSMSGSNDFDSLVKSLVSDSSSTMSNIYSEEAVLVSDFVNLHKLQNRSKLGFLLSDHLKNALLNKGIVVKQVELGQEFQYGEKGLNLLTRQYQDIRKKSVSSKYAFVGTYTITTKNLIVFLKLIEIETGNILSSSSAKTSIDDEILELEGIKDQKIFIKRPIVL